MEIHSLLDHCSGEGDLAYFYLARMLNVSFDVEFYFDVRDLPGFLSEINEIYVVEYSDDDLMYRAYSIKDVDYLCTNTNITRRVMGEDDDAYGNKLMFFKKAIRYDSSKGKLSRIKSIKARYLFYDKEMRDNEFYTRTKMGGFSLVKIIEDGNYYHVSPCSIDAHVGMLYVKSDVLQLMKKIYTTYSEFERNIFLKSLNANKDDYSKEIKVHKNNFKIYTPKSFVKLIKEEFLDENSSNRFYNSIMVGILCAVFEEDESLRHSYLYRSNYNAILNDDDLSSLIHSLYSNVSHALKEMRVETKAFYIFQALLEDRSGLKKLIFSKTKDNSRKRSELFTLEELDDYRLYIRGLLYGNKGVKEADLFPEGSVFREFVLAVDTIRTKHPSSKYSSSEQLSSFVKRMKAHISRDSAYDLRQLAELVLKYD